MNAHTFFVPDFMIVARRNLEERAFKNTLHANIDFILFCKILRRVGHPESHAFYVQGTSPANARAVLQDRVSPLLSLSPR